MVVVLALLGGWGPRRECVRHPGADEPVKTVKDGCCSKAAEHGEDREPAPAPCKGPCSQCTKTCCGYGAMFVTQGAGVITGEIERVSGALWGDDRVVLGPVGQSIFHPPRVG